MSWSMLAAAVGGYVGTSWMLAAGREAGWSRLGFALRWAIMVLVVGVAVPVLLGDCEPRP